MHQHASTIAFSSLHRCALANTYVHVVSCTCALLQSPFYSILHYKINRLWACKKRQKSRRKRLTGCMQQGKAEQAGGRATYLRCYKKQLFSARLFNRSLLSGQRTETDANATDYITIQLFTFLSSSIKLFHYSQYSCIYQYFCWTLLHTVSSKEWFNCLFNGWCHPSPCMTIGGRGSKL